MYGFLDEYNKYASDEQIDFVKKEFGLRKFEEWASEQK